MKKNKPILIIVIILLIISVLLIIKQTNTTLRKAISDFAIEDTASITKVFMSDKKNSSILLTRQPDGKWMLNNKYAANQQVMNIFLKTMYNVTAAAPVSKVAFKNVVARMAAIAVKVEIYQQVYRIDLFGRIKLFRHEKLIKTFYVGDNTSDSMGTYMLMEGAKEPFVVVIQSFRGFLSTRFIPDEDQWREQTIFKIKLKDIKSVKMEFPVTPDSSFLINGIGKFKYTLTQLADNRSIPYDTMKLLSFLASFEDIKYETLLNHIYDKKKIDSIKSSPIWHIITVTGIDGKSTMIKTYRRKPQYGEYYDEATKQKVIYDRDRLFALINDDKDLTLIQFFVFEKILKSVNYFKKN